MSEKINDNATKATDAIADVSEMSADTAIEHAKRAFALKKYDQAVEYYARALEVVTLELGEDAPQVADLYFSYGKALLENAIAQNSVLGKEQQKEDGDEDEDKACPITDTLKAASASKSTSGPILSFSGDAEDAPEEPDPAVDLFAQATADVDAAEAAAAENDEEDDEAEPEDDFNAAWEVLEMARSIYSKQKDASQGDQELSLKLADTYIALGDVSLETDLLDMLSNQRLPPEKFDQAITDYESALTLKEEILPVFSRQIAEAHYKLCIVLDLTSGRLADAIAHAEKALQSIESRLGELERAKSSPTEQRDPKADKKGKGKAPAVLKDESIQNMTPAQVEGEIKELSELKDDLAVKVEELKTSPNDSVQESAPALAAKALDKELNASATSSSSGPVVVNDLTKVVRKKKNPATEAESNKRKAEDDGEGSGSEKKPKLDG
ncbi:hypothetical protein VNI00_002815 [Paramarasmius palmivorus]|uniref:Tetratricopeptide SHNi-TPR domain-containing protein n=1 Tax=Paramarasmius palmivorus TaxID=297713 RepID=A0AAW0DYF4_9AGAR